MIPVLHGVWAAAGGLVGDFEHIETQSVGSGGAASVTFSSIPGTYKHLQLRAFVPFASGVNSVALQFNGDTGSNYTFHQIYGTGSAAGSNAATSATKAGLGITSTGSPYGSVAVIDLLDYVSTSKYKTARSLTGTDSNGAGVVSLRSSLWLSTNAISSILVAFDNAVNLPQYSTFSLYGVK